MRHRALRRRYGHTHFAPLSERDLDFMVKELGIHHAISYAERIANVRGPLSEQYHDATQRLLARAVASGHIQVP